jgi:hypothetical protein
VLRSVFFFFFFRFSLFSHWSSFFLRSSKNLFARWLLFQI